MRAMDGLDAECDTITHGRYLLLDIQNENYDFLAFVDSRSISDLGGGRRLSSSGATNTVTVSPVAFGAGLMALGAVVRISVPRARFCGASPSSLRNVAFDIGLHLPSDTFDEPLFVASVGRLTPRLFEFLSQLAHRHALEQSDLFVDVDLH